MKKYRSFTLATRVICLSFLLCNITACSQKKSDPSPKKTNSEMLTAVDAWTESKVEFGNSVAALAEMPLDPTVSPFEVFSFKANGDFTGKANYIHAGTWKFTNADQTAISISYVDSGDTFTFAATVSFADTGDLVFLFPKGQYKYRRADGSVSAYPYARETFSHK